MSCLFLNCWLILNCKKLKYNYHFSPPAPLRFPFHPLSNLWSLFCDYCYSKWTQPAAFINSFAYVFRTFCCSGREGRGQLIIPLGHPKFYSGCNRVTIVLYGGIAVCFLGNRVLTGLCHMGVWSWNTSHKGLVCQVIWQ